MPYSLLIVDSDVIFAEPVCKEFTSRSVHTTWQTDAAHTVQWAVQHQPTAVILSADLPEESGYATYAELKDNPETEGVPVIVTSRESTQETFEKHRSFGSEADVYVQKPVSVMALIETVWPILQVRGPLQPTPEREPSEESKEHAVEPAPDPKKPKRSLWKRFFG